LRGLDDEEEIVESSGLLGGVTAHYLRMLCENPWNGGGGYTPEQVGRMSLDQIWFRLCDIEVLKRKVGGRSEKMESSEVISMVKADEDGMIRGVAADGTSIRGRIRGKSLARELMEKEAARKEKEEQWKKRKENRRRKRRGE